jgi:hypothetical protein
MRKILILFFVISTLLFAVEFQEKGNVIIRKNDDGSVSTIPVDNNNPDYLAYLYFKKTGALPSTKTNDTETEKLKQIIKKLTDKTGVVLTDDEKAVIEIKAVQPIEIK